MLLYAVSGLINGVLVTCLGIFVFLNNKKSELNFKYARFCLFVAFWSYCYCLWHFATTVDDALFWSRSLMAGAIFIPVSFMDFAFSLIEIREQNKKFVRFGYIIFVCFLFMDFTPLFIKDMRPMLGFPFWPVPGKAFSFFLPVWLFYCVYPCYLLFQRYKIFSGYKREQIKYVLIAILIGYSTGSTNYFLWYGIPIPPVGNLIVPLFVGMMAYAIVRYRLMDIRVITTRAGIFLIIYAFVMGLPFWLGFNYGYDFHVLLSGMILATLGPIIYGMLKKKAENILLAEQRQYQKILLQASRGMVEEHNLARLLQLIVRIIKRVVKVNFAAAYIFIPETKAFELQAIRETKKQDKLLEINESHPIVRLIIEHREPIILEELPAETRRAISIGLDSVLIIPSFVQDKCLGFMILGKKNNNEAYSDDDISVFKTLANEAGLAIENSQFIENVKHTQEMLFNAEKLASIGGMADGLAHQIKNRLYEFSIVSQNMEYDIEDVKKLIPDIIEQNQLLRDKLDFIAKGAKTTIDNVQRTNQIIQGILNFARTEQNEITFSRFPLREIIDPAASLVKIKHQLAALPLHVELPEDGTIYGIKGQLQECLYNCLDNACEAISEKVEYRLTQDEKKVFIPEITIRLNHLDNHDLIEIADNGIGIKEEDGPKIFAAFFTTKPSSKSGSGIGNYVGKRMIEEHHQGKMYFTSRYMEGTSFFIRLPAH